MEDKRNGVYSATGELRNVVVGKCEGTKSFGRFKLTRVNNIKMDLKEIWWEAVDLIHVD